jgi:hypothetical protein
MTLERFQTQQWHKCLGTTADHPHIMGKNVGQVITYAQISQGVEVMKDNASKK